MSKLKLNKMSGLKLVEGMIQQAQSFVAYYKTLIDEGLDAKSALQAAIAYQNSQIKAATLVTVEREKMLMQLTQPRNRAMN
jgi:hypothetical protein